MILRRRSRADRWAAKAEEVPPAARVGVAVGVGLVLLALAFVARRILWRGVAVVADAVEEVADTVEDVAEDVRDAAQARAE
jgi:divalent metal cation (Fe/Co/Zn/Cd) transporter